MSEATEPCENRLLNAEEGVSFLIIATPVPPMPLMILREGFGDNGLTNSYDLLQRVIKESHFKAESMSSDQLEVLRNKKLEAYQRMWEGIKNLNNGAERYEDPPCDWTITAIKESYSIFQQYFRDMVKIYTSSDSTPDLRFYPIDYMTPNDAIVWKTRDHLMALTIVWESFDTVNHLPQSPNRIIYDRESLKHLPYYQLVGMYAHKIRLN
eukprot:764432-Hanusia_phi.AAC.1